MSVGAGICFGPLIASLVSRWLNYVQTFYFFASYMLAFGMLAVFFVPAKINFSETKQINGQLPVSTGITYG